MKDELLGIEHELGAGDGDAYRRHLADEAVIVVRGWCSVATSASRRGETTYEAAMSSVYVRRGGRWQLALHQQTPVS